MDGVHQDHPYPEDCLTEYLERDTQTHFFHYKINTLRGIGHPSLKIITFGRNVHCND
jgi:hypothetical protein